MMFLIAPETTVTLKGLEESSMMPYLLGAFLFVAIVSLLIIGLLKDNRDEKCKSMSVSNATHRKAFNEDGDLGQMTISGVDVEGTYDVD